MVGRIELPRFQSEILLDFVIDTGSSQTILPFFAAELMSVDPNLFEREREGYGVGGSAMLKEEPAVLKFNDGDFEYEYRIIVGCHPAPNDVPALLGRDILNKWHLQIDRSRGLLAGEPRQWDSRRPIGPLAD
ncbi:MAG: hypothetical protein JSS65_01905 [Armatimonadetes bacterium]|nr:hypothetical protein [Armatimonadota bacterium]